MKLDQPTRMHLYGGIVTAIALAAWLEIAKHFGAPMAVAVGGTMAWGFVEVYQWARGNGTPEAKDWFWGALPSVLLAFVLWLAP